MNRFRPSTLAVAIVLSLCAIDAHASDAMPTNPYSPARYHPYRHGVIPTLDVQRAMRSWKATQPAATNSPMLAFGGGTNGVGVTSGPNKVYLVFYGSQWGTASTDGNGNLKFSNDPYGAAGAAQQMFKGIGTNGETWQADLTQWCDGAGISAGAMSCPSTGVNFVPYQTGILAGVWYDNTQLSPPSATAAQLGNEAIAAAAHFGNTTAASNRYAYYVIMSPTGTNPDLYLGQYCAWHDYTADVGVTSPYGEMAFSNQPYNMDQSINCGVDFVNTGTAGLLDGYTITLGHEWHETLSDQFPAGGWNNHDTGTYAGQENSDECAWISPGKPGGAANVTFATGTFAEQSSWSNDTNQCSMTHAILHYTPVQVVNNPGFETTGSWIASSPALICNTGCPGESAYAGKGFAWLDGQAVAHTDVLSQTVTLPAGRTKATFNYFLHINTNEPSKVAKDTLSVAVYSGSTLLKTLQVYSNLDHNTGYTMRTHDLSAYIGQTITLRFTGTEDAKFQTSFVLDNVTLTVQ